MAGRPKRRENMQRLANLYPAEAQSIFDDVAAGKPLHVIAAFLDVTRSALTDWLEDPQRIGTYKRAREKAASALAEQTVEIADRQALDAQGEPVPDVQRDKLRIQTRQWLASRWDRSTYGDQKQADVTVNVNMLHLDALRHVNARRNAVVDTAPKCLPSADNTTD